MEIKDDPKPKENDRRAVYMVKRHGANFQGETCGFANKVADRLVAEGIAVELDKDGKPIFPPPKAMADPEIEAGPEGAEDTGNQQATKRSRPPVDPNADPFTIDGLDKKVINALAKADPPITDPDGVRAWVGSGRELDDIHGIGPGTAKLLKDMYCSDMDETDGTESGGSGESEEETDEESDSDEEDGFDEESEDL